MTGIADLPRAVEGLPAELRALATSLYRIDAYVGTLEAPPEMEPWIAKLFGSVDAVRAQRIVRVTDLVSLEGALFNELRARRPMEVKGAEEVRKTIDSAANDPFCDVATGTPADEFGRVEGRHGTSVSNVAKYDGFHGVLVFREHDPLAPVGPDVLADHFATAREWACRAYRSDPSARYYFLMWNALWRAGGSIVHGHMQMTVTRGMHYPKVEALRRRSLAYRRETGRDHLDDVWRVHEALGLGVEVAGARLFATLTPVKEREVVVLGRPGEDERALAGAVAHAVAALRREGVLAHNMAVYLPPLSDDGEDWSGFAPLVRLVDRGDPANRTSDIGAMELYAASVISSDPFRVADALRRG